MATSRGAQWLSALLLVAVMWAMVLYSARERQDLPAGEVQLERASRYLKDGMLEQALLHFDAAVIQVPDHPGAHMGRALVMLAQGDNVTAEAILTGLLTHLAASDSPKAVAARAAAHANRGIARDRMGRHLEALADYRAALAMDPVTVAGPGIVDRVLYGADQIATVRQRADYLTGQLALPPEQQLLSVPPLDARQRMYEP